jgi:lipoprotein-anchoring transpeptidase ErfK/SrfK
MHRRLAGVALLGAAAAAAAALLHDSFHSQTPAAGAGPSFSVEARNLPPPERPAFTVAEPVPLWPDETRARFAPVAQPVQARKEPASTTAALTSLGLETPEGTTNIVLVLAERPRPDGLWVRVRLPVLPNNLTGWVPRRALGGYQSVHTHLVVDRARLTATLFYDGRKVFTAAVGIGTPDAPTPAGDFYIRERLDGFGDPFYGPAAFGTSARSAVLTDWPGGGFVGIHGTNQPELIPGRISHGCVRLRNADILNLSKMMPVGTPLTIR